MPPARESLAVSGSPGQMPSGSTIGGQFRIDGVLHQDAVSQTYRATDLNHRSSAAVRIIPMRALGAASEQLEADVEKASALVHKNLVEVLNVGREGDFYYIATELLDGQTLREFVDGRQEAGRNVSFKGACNLITHIANGLERAASSLPHGGLNPAAVWVSKAGRVKVAELGLSRTLPSLGRRGGPPGAPDQAYVAPEVLAGQPATLASDAYSLGIILYEVLTGKLPAAPLRPVSQVAEDAPPTIDGVILKALSRDPAARFGSVMELRQALANVQAGGPGVVPVQQSVPPQQSMAPQQVAPAQQQGSGLVQMPGARPAAAAVQAVTAELPGGGDEPRRSTFGRSFNLADVAGGAVDDAQERWLIQKDRLDFGPFSLAQIRAQIARGEILGEHTIVDSDTGSRMLVREFPALRDFSKHSERNLEQQRRAHAEIKHEKTEKRKARFTFMVVGVTILAILGGGGYWVLTRKASDRAKLATREEGEAEVDAFLKDVKLNFASAKVAKKPSGGGHHSGGGATATDSDFSNDSNFGDASKYANAGDEILDDVTVEETMRNHYRGLVPCLMQERRRNASVSEMRVDFVIRGNGRVDRVKVNDQKSGPFAQCVLAHMPAFPKFNGVKTIASWSMSMR